MRSIAENKKILRRKFQIKGDATNKSKRRKSRIAPDYILGKRLTVEDKHIWLKAYDKEQVSEIPTHIKHLCNKLGCYFEIEEPTDEDLMKEEDVEAKLFQMQEYKSYSSMMEGLQTLGKADI